MLEIEIMHCGFVIRCFDFHNKHESMSGLVSGACLLATDLRAIFNLPDPDWEAITADTKFPGMVREGDDSVVVSNLPAEVVAFAGWILATSGPRYAIACRCSKRGNTARDFHKGGAAERFPVVVTQPARQMLVNGLASMGDTSEWLETKQLSYFLQISRMTLNRWCRCGKLPAPLKVGGRNRWRCDQVLAWLGAASGSPRAGDLDQQTPRSRNARRLALSGQERCPN